MSSNLTLTLAQDNYAFAVEFDRWDGERAQFLWRVIVDGETIGYGDDLRLGSLKDPCEAEALETLLTFLSAYAESVNYSGGHDGANVGLFPESVRPLAQAIGSDGFAMLAESLARKDDQ